MQKWINNLDKMIDEELTKQIYGTVLSWRTKSPNKPLSASRQQEHSPDCHGSYTSPAAFIVATQLEDGGIPSNNVTLHSSWNSPFSGPMETFT
jgi:hypothetical protein